MTRITGLHGLGERMSPAGGGAGVDLLDAGYWILDAGYWMVDSAHRAEARSY